MARFLLTVGLGLVALAGLAAAASVLAYRTEPERAGTLTVAGLDRPVSVAWDDSGRVWVEGADDVALAAGLGYAHAADDSWAAALWRQAALGGLAEWFGDDARAADLHARTLGFEALARQTYEALGADDRALLDAYAAGASAAFAQPGVVQSDAFIVADVVPAGWRPWDALAIERLHAYLAAPALQRDSTWMRAARTDTTVAAFVRADSVFRATLGATGGGYDRVYALDGTPDRMLVQQLSAGTSALPLLSSAVLVTPERTTVALTIPGTLVSPTGWSGGLGWGVALGTPLTLEPYNGPAPPPVYSRIVERDGDETLLEVTRDSSGLVLRPGALAAPDTTVVDSLAAPGAAGPPAAPITTLPTAVSPAPTATASGWRVRWRGFRLGTDLGAFRALRAGRRPERFAFIDGGLAATTEATRVLGSPRLAVRTGRVALVAQDSLARYAAAVLGAPPISETDVAADSVAADSLGDHQPRTVAMDDRDLTSGWAREQLRPLIAALGARDSLDDVLQEPFAYLNGWDGAYRADDIAPSVFEWWLWAHRDYTGHLPDLTDSLDVALLPSTLRIARAELRDRYGTFPADWRWGLVQGGPTYPVLGTRQMAAARKFRRPFGPPGGHPTSALPGPSVVIEGPQPGLAVWSLRTDLTTGVIALRSPALRPLADAYIDPDVGPDGPLLILDPSAPMPERRLTLRPAS